MSGQSGSRKVRIRVQCQKAGSGHACSHEEVPTLAASAMAPDLPLNAVLFSGVHRTAGEDVLPGRG